VAPLTARVVAAQQRLALRVATWLRLVAAWCLRQAEGLDPTPDDPATPTLRRLIAELAPLDKYRGSVKRGMVLRRAQRTFPDRPERELALLLEQLYTGDER
jgi:hypothetical protein